MVAASLLTVGVTTSPKAQAANLIWNQTGAGPYSWTDSANWGGSGFPNAVGDVATMSGALAGAQTVNLNAVITVGELNFGASQPPSAPGYTLAGGTNGLLILDDSDGAVSINKLSGSPSLDTISAAIQFNDALTISNNSGGGTLTLSGAIRSASSDITFSGTGTVAAGSIIVSGVISTGGNLVKNDAVFTRLSGANTYAGTTAVNAGTLQISNAAALPARSAVTVASGATLDYVNTATAIGSISGAGTVTNQGTAARILTIGRNETSTTFTGRFIGPANKTFLAITKLGNGTLTLKPSGSTAAGDYTGNTIISGGKITLDTSDSSLTSAFLAATPLQLAGGDFEMVGRNGQSVSQTLGNFTLSATGGKIALTPNGGAATDLTLGTLTATASGGTLLVEAPSTTSLKLTTTQIASSALNGRLVFTDGTANSFNWAFNNNAAANNISGFTSSTTLVATGGTTGTSYILTAAGGATTQSGATTIGTLKLTGTGAQTLDLSTFNMQLGGGATSTPGAILIDGTANWTIDGAGQLTANTPATSPDLIFHHYGTGTLTVNAGIGNAAAAALVKAGPGTLVLAGAKTFTGAVFVNGGTLQFSNNNQLGNATGPTIVTIRDGAILNYTGATATIAATGTASHTFSLSGGNGTISVVSGTTLTLSGAISGAGSLVKAGAGTLTLGAAATHSGSTFINAGVLLTNAADLLPSTPVTIASGATWNMSAGNDSVGALLGAGIVSAGTTARGLTIGADNVSGTFSGSFTGGAAHTLTKSGTGIQTLDGTTRSVWTGNHIVNGGVLRLGASNVLATGTPMFVANAAGPAMLELAASVTQTIASLSFGGSGVTDTSQGNVLIGSGATLTVGGTLTYNISTTTFNQLPAYISGAGTYSLGGAARTFSISDSNSIASDQPELTISVPITATGAFGPTKSGFGNLMLSGDNTFTGTTTLTTGGLFLDYRTVNGSKLSSTAALTLNGGGNLVLLGNASADTSQTVASTTLASGGFSTIRLTPGGSQKILLNLGAFTRAASAGTLRLNLPTGTQDATNGFRTSTANLNGILGGWATVSDVTGATNFAANDGSGGVVLATSAAKSDVTTWASADNVSDAVSGYSGTLSQNSVINSLRFSSAADSTVTIASGAVLGILSGGVLQTAVTGGATASPTITGGRLASGSGSELIFITDVTTPSRPLVASSAIGGSHTLTKSGNGILRLSGTNDFTGAVTLQAGTLQVEGGDAIGDNSLVNLNNNRSSVFELLANETIGGVTGGNTAQGGESNVRLNANTLSINQSTSQTFTGLLVGAAGSSLVLNDGSVGTFSPTSNNANFLGSVVINGGAFQLNGTTSIIGASSFTVTRASLLINYNGAGNPSSRIGDSSPITLNSADGSLSGETLIRGLTLLRDTTGTATEVAGELRISSGASYFSANVTNGATGLTASNFLRADSATLSVRGRAFGAGSGVRGFLRITSASANETTFLTTLVGGTGGAGTQTIPIVPWAIGQTHDAALADSVMGNTLVTYSTALEGIRPLDLATEYRTFATRTLVTENVRESLTANLTGIVGTTVNALVLDNANPTTGTLNITGTGAGQTLAVTSGALLFTATGATSGGPAMGLTLGGFDSGITVGSTNEYVVFVQNPSSAVGGGVVTATISSPLSSTADITKSGRGTLVLSVANTAGGGTRKTTINEGVLQIDALDKVGGTTGALVLAGGTLRFAGVFDPSSRTISLLAGGGTFDTNGNNIALSNSLGGGTGPFTKSGAGTLTLNASTLRTGATSVTGGTLAIGINDAIGIGATLTVRGGATLALSSFSLSTSSLGLIGAGSNAVTGSGTVTVSGSANFDQGSVSPVLAGAMKLVKVTPGLVTISNAANTFTGLTSVNNGILSINAVANSGSASSLGAPTGDSAAIRLGNGVTSGTLRISAGGSAGTTDRGFWLTGTTGGGVIDNDGAAALILNGSISGHGGESKVLTLQGGSVGFVNVVGGVISNGFGTIGLTKSEAGTWSLAGANTYTGTTTVNGGLLRLDFANATPTTNLISASSVLTLGGGTLGVVGKSSTVNAQTFASTTLTVGTFGAASADGTGATSLALALGTLTRAANSGLDFELLGGATISVAGLLTNNGIVTSTATGAAYATFNRTDWANFSSGAPVAVASYSASFGAGLNTDIAATSSPSAFLTNTLRFNAAGTTTLTLTGINTLAAGGLLIGKDAGAVTLGGSSASLAGFAHTTSAGELNVFQYSSSSATISAAVINTPSAPSFLLAAVTGTALNKFGNGVLVLSSARNAYTGETNVGSGTLRLGAANVIPNGIGIAASGNVTIGAAGTLDLAGFSDTINGLAGSGVVDSSTAGTMRLTLGDNAAAQTFSGIIRNTSGTLSLLKTGTGIQTLAGANTYSGSTTISQGTLTLNFTAAGAPLDNILPATALTIGSGTLSLTGSTVANAQSFSGITLAGGAAVAIAGTTPATTLSLGAIARGASSSSLNFTIPATSVISTTTTNNAAGILGGWATVGGADWATVSATGRVTALSAYAGTLPTATGAATANYTLAAAQTQTADVALNSLKITGGTAYTLTTGSFALTLGSGGAGGIVASNTETVTIGAAVSGTGLVGPAAGNEFIVFNSGALLFNAPIRGAGLTKSGAGTLTLRSTTNAALTGTVAVNGGTLDIDGANRINGATILLLNGGTFYANGAFSFTQNLSLGAAGGTIRQDNDSDRTLGGSAAMTFVGTGPRTLTINNNRNSRVYTLQSAIGDADASSPTSISVSANGNEAILRLNPSAASNYTGNTTITRGILRLNRSDAVNGAGGLLSTATSGNIIFAATGTNRAILETNSTAGTITRAVGYGPGQISWQGNGGFSNSTSLTQVVNLGGSAAELTWGAGGFVPTDRELQFGQPAANNLGSQGAIDFRNGINLGAATRTINVSTANLGANSGITAILSGGITGGPNAGITKSGTGTLLFTGANSSTTASLTITEGSLIFEDDSAVFASAAPNITLLSAEGRAAIGKLGDTNPIATWGTKIVNAGTAFGTFLLGADSSATLDFRGYSNMRLAGFDADSFVEGAAPTVTRSPVFTGTIIPSSNGYRLGGTGTASGAGASLLTLIIGRSNVFTGSNQLSMSSGHVTITQVNDFSGGTTLLNNGIEGSALGIGSSAALGTGAVTFGGSGNTFRWGAINGDQLVANNISWGSNIGSNWAPAGDQASDGFLANQNQGTLAFLGSIDQAGRGNPTITTRVRGTLFHGDWKGGAGQGLTWATGTGYVSLLSTSANAGVEKTYAGKTTLNDNAVIVIDSESSFGASGELTLGTSVIALQPGSGAVTLARNFANTAAKNPSFNTPQGSTLTLTGTMSGSTTGTFVKQGLGTLVLQGDATGLLTTGSLQLRSGTLRLDAAARGGTVFTSGLGITLGYSVGQSATANYGSGTTLEITGTSAQSFGAVTVNPRAHAIVLTGAMPLTLGTITRTGGSTLNFSVAAGATVASTTAAVASLVNGATTWNDNDWAAASGSAITQYTAYTVLSGAAPSITSTAAANYNISGATGTITLAAAGTLAAPNNSNTLRYSDAGDRIIDVRTSGGAAGFWRLGTGGAAGGGVTNAGGILVASGAGALTIGVASDATGGTIMAGGTTTNTLGDLVFISNSSSDITVNSAVVNNNGTTGATQLSYDGRSTGKLILAGANTFTGSIFINKGVLEVGTVNSVASAGPLGQGTASATNILLNGGTFRANLTADGSTDKGFTVQAPSDLEVVANTLTLNSTLSGPGSDLYNLSAFLPGMLRKTGAGTLELRDLATGNTANFNLSVKVAAGTLLLNKATNNTFALLTGVSTTNNSTNVTVGNTSGLIPGTPISGPGITGGAFIASVTNSTTFVLSTVATATASGVSLTLTPISAVNLAGGAGVIVDSVASGVAPVLRLSGTGGNQISDDSSVVVMGDKAVKGIFDLNGKSETIDGLAGGGIVRSGIAGTVTLSLGGNNSAGISAYTLAAAAAGVNTTGLNSFSGTIEDGSGTVSLTKVGSGTQILRSAQTYSGATTVTAGVLRLASENALPSGAGKGDVTLQGANTGINLGANASTGSDKVLAPGTLDLAGFNQTINALNSSTGGIVTNNPFLDWDGTSWDVASARRGTKTLTVGASGSNGAFDGIIQDGFAVAPGAITGTGYVGVISLVKTGTGTQTLSGANTFGGATAVQNGTLVLTGGDNRLPATTALTLGNGTDSGVLQVGGAGVVSQTIAGLATSGTGAGNKVVGGNAANSTLIVNQSGTGTYAGALGGAGTNENKLNFILQGGGTLTLSGANTLAGSTTVRGASTLVLASALANSALNIGGASAGTVVTSQALGGLVTLGAGGTLAPGLAVASDTAILTLSGGMTMSAGSFLALQVGVTNDLLRVSGGTLTFNGGSISLSETSGLAVGTYDLIDYSGATLAGSGITSLGLTSSVLGAANLYVTLQDDSVNSRVQLVVDNARFWSGSVGRTWEASQSVANWSPAEYFVSGDKVLFRDTYPSGSGNANVVNTTIELLAGVSATPAAMTFSNSAVDYVLHGAGEIAGTTGLSKGGTGGLTILNANAFTGATTISEGYVEMRHASALGTTAGGVTVSAGGTLRLSGGIAVGAKALTLAGTGAGAGGALRNISGANSYAGAVTLGGAARINSDAGVLTLSGAFDNNANLLTLGGAGDILVSGAIAGAGGLVVDGTGVVTLSATTSTFSGQTVVKSGVLSLSKIGSVGQAGGLGTVTGTANGTIALGDLATTGTLHWTGSSNETTDRVIDLVGTTGGAVIEASGSGALTISQAIAATGVGAKTLTLAGAGGTTLAPNSVGAIADGSSGGLSLVKTGTGVWSLSAANSYAGTTSILQGTLQLGANQNFGSLTLGGLSRASSTLALGSSVATLTGDLTYSGVNNSAGAAISGAGSLDLGGAPDAVAPISRIFAVASSQAAGGADLTVSAVISDTGGVTSTFANGLTKTGAGTLVLTGANTYVGATSVDGGRLSVSPQAIVNSLTINVGSGATAGALDLYADAAVASLTFTGNNVLNVGGATAKGGLGFNLSGASADSIVLSATGTLTVGAAGALINARALTAVTTGSYTLIDATNNGNTATITGFDLGVLTGGYAYSLDNSAGGQLKLNVGAAAAGPYYWTGARSTGSWATLGGNGTTSNWATGSSAGPDAGATPGVIAVVFDGASAATTTLDQPYSITGLTLSGNGNVTIDSGSGDGVLTLGNGGVSVATGATSTGHTIGANVVLGSAQTWTVADAGQLLTVGGDVAGSGLLTKAGAGVLVLSGVNTFTGGVDLTAGTARVTNAGSLGASSGALTIGAATLQATASFADARGVTLGDAASTVSVDAARTLTLSGKLTGSGKLNATGAGTLVLDDSASANDFSGGSALSGGGVVRIVNSTGLGSGALALNAATLRVGGTFTYAPAVTLGASSSAVAVDAGRTLTLTGKLTGAGALNATGAGTLVLDDSASANDFTGGSVLSGGVVRVGSLTALGSGSVTINAATLQATASLSYSGRDFVLGDVASALVVASGDTFTVTNGASTAVSGAGRLNADVAGVLILDDALNANTFTGGSVLSGGGVVRISTATSLGAQAGTAALKDITLQVLESVTTTRGFTFGSTASRITVDSGKTFAISGVIADGAQRGVLAKSGAGVLELSGENTFSGGVNVTSGTLLASNSTGSATGTGAVSVTGATTVFGGAGTVSGIVTVGSGSTLSPGGAATAGTITLGGLTLAANSKLAFQLGANTAASDKIVVNGSGGFTASGGALTLDTTTLTGFGNGTYNLITYAGALGGSFTNLSLASPNFANAAGDKFFGFLVNNTGSVDLQTTNSLTWNGDVSGTKWVNSTSTDANFKVGSVTGVNFQDTMAAVFDDTATSYLVNLPGTVTPASVTFNAATDYVLQGAGKITGLSTLSKSGGGLLTIATANDFSGAVSLLAGSLEMKDPSALGSGSIAITPGASLRLNDDGSGPIALGSRITSYGGGAVIVNVAGQNSATLPAGSLAGPTSFNSEAGKLTLAGSIAPGGDNRHITLLGLGGDFELAGASLSGGNFNFTATMNGGQALITPNINVGNQSVIVNGTGSTTFSGTLASGSGGNGLSVSNAGTNTFNGTVTVNGTGGGISLAGGTNTFAQNVTINASGTLAVSGGTTVFGAGRTVTTNGGAVSLTGTANTTFDANISSGGGAWSVSSSGNTTVNGAITGSGALTKTGLGTLAFNAPNPNYNGAIVFTGASGANRGVILATANNALGLGAVSATYVSGATGGQVRLSGGISLPNAFSTTGEGAAGGVSGIIRSMTGANVLTGNVTLTGGGGSSTYRADTGASLAFNGSIGADTNTGRFIVLVGGGDFSFGSGGSIVQTLTTTGSTGLWSTNTGTTTINSIANTYALSTGIGAGSMLVVSSLSNGGVAGSLGAATTASGNLLLDGGTLRYAGSGAQSTDRLFSIGSADNGGGGATLDASGTTSADTMSFLGAGAIGFTGMTGAGTSGAEAGFRTLTLTGTNSGANTLASVIGDQTAVTGATSLVKSGTGTWVVTGNNTFTGGTTLSAGTLRAGHASAFGSLATQALALNGGTLTSDGATARVFANNVTIGGDIVFGAAATFTGALTFDGTVGLGAAVRTLTINSDVTFGGIVSGDSAGGLTKAGDGTLTLSAGNTFAGATNVTAGTLATSGDARLSTTSGVTVGASGILSLGGSETIGSLTNAGTVTIAAGKTLTTGASSYTLAGTISGAGALTKAGAGTLTLSSGGTFSYTGATGISDGTLALGASNQLGDASALNVTGGVLDFAGFSDTVGAVTLTGGSITGTTGVLTATSVTADTTTTATLSAKLGGAATLTMTGSGVLTVSGDNSFTGGTTISAGTLATNGDARLSTTSGVTVGASGTLSLGGSETLNSFSNSGTVTIASGKTLTTGASSYTLAGTISGAGALTKAGAGTLTLSGGGTFSYAGLTTVSGGELALGADDQLGNSNAITVSGGILALAGFSDTVGTITLTSGSITGTTGVLTATSITSGTTTTATLSAKLGGATTLAMNGTGVLTVSGDNAYAGGTTISAGTVRAGHANAFGTGFLTLDGGTLTSDGTTARAFANEVTFGGAFTFGAATTHTGALTFDGTVGLGAVTRTLTVDSDVTFAGIVSAGGLIKAGGGALTLSGDNTFSGGTTLSAGTVRVGHADAFGSGFLTLDGGTLTSDGTTARAFANEVTFGGDIALGAATTFTGALTFDGTVGLGAVTRTLTVDSDVTFAGIVSAGGLIKAGGGALTLSGDNTFSGGTTLSAGTVRAGHADAFGAGSLTLNAGRLTSDGATARAFANNVTVGGDIALGAATTFTGALTFDGAVGLGAAARTLTIDSAVTFAGGVTSADQNLTIGGAGDVTISTLGLNLGLGSLTMNGTGTLLLSVANTFSGATINSGTIKVGASGSLGSGTVNVGASGTLDLNNQTISNPVVLANGAVLTGGTFVASSLPTTTGTLDVVLQGDGVTLTKTDAGRLELTGDNTYTGATSVSGGGTIAIADFGNGSTASPLGITSLSDPTKLILSSGATLEFNGGTSAVTSRSFTIGGSAGISATGTGTLEFTSASQIATTGTAPALTLSANNSGTNRFAASLAEGNTALATLAINGTGVWVIGTGANRFKNDIRIEAATGATIGLENASLPSGATLAVANNATVRWESGNTTGVKLEVAAGTTAKLDLGANNVVFSTAPVVTGTGSTTLEKQGSGTLRIAEGVSAPTVNVTLPANSGLLAVNGTIGSVTLASGSKLGGSGAVASATLVSGAILSPGNSPGMFTVGDLALPGGSYYDWQVQDATNHDTGYDKLTVTGNLDLTGASPTNRVILRIASLLGNGDGTALGNPLNFGPPGGASSIRTFQFGQVGGVLLNSGQNISDVFEINVSGFTYTDGSSSNAALWSIAWNQGSGAITLTAVPEPSTYGFGLGALALAAAAIRGRKRQAKA